MIVKAKKVRVIKPTDPSMIFEGDHWFTVKNVPGGKWQVIESYCTEEDAHEAATDAAKAGKMQIVINISNVAEFVEPEDAVI